MADSKLACHELLSNFIGECSTWFWTMVQALAVIITLIFIYKQVRAQRYGNMLTYSHILREYWESPRMVQSRKETCKNSKTGNRAIGSEEGNVLSFFEEIGLLVEKEAVSIEYAWEAYSYFIEYYWMILKPNIEKFRRDTNDDQWYCKFEILVGSMEKYAERKGIRFGNKFDHEVDEFIAEESK